MWPGEDLGDAVRQQPSSGGLLDASHLAKFFDGSKTVFSVGSAVAVAALVESQEETVGEAIVNQ